MVFAACSDDVRRWSYTLANWADEGDADATTGSGDDDVDGLVVLDRIPGHADQIIARSAPCGSTPNELRAEA